MDPVTIGVTLAVAVFSVVCYVLFKAATRESTFEETYGKDRLKLLTEEKQSVKNKPKNGGKVKKVTKIEKKTSYEKPELSGKSSETVKLEVKTVDPIEAPKSSNSNANIVDNEETVPVPTNKPTESSAPPKTNADLKSAVNKKNKKRAPKTADSVDSTSESISKVEVAPTTASNKPTNDVSPANRRVKRGSPEHANVNLVQLIERLSSSEEFGPEYATFVSQLTEQAKQKESKSNEMIAKLQREISTKSHELETLHDQLYEAQTKFVQIQSLEQALKDEKERHNIYMSSVNPKLAENYRLVENVRKLEEQIGVQSKAHANSMDKLKRESEQIVTQLRTSLTQTNNQLHQKDMFIKEMEQEYSQKLNSTKEKETEFGVKDSLIEELKETIKQKDHQIGQIKEENRLKDHSADKTIEDLKQREQQLIREKEEQVQEANVKLETELKESLERIDELRKRNYKLLESINTLYNNKNPNTSDENKKPSKESQEIGVA